MKSSSVIWTIVACAMLVFVFSGDEDSRSSQANEYQYETDSSNPKLGLSDEEFAGETYGEFDERRDSYNGSRGAVGGYECTEDCSGHNAGREWAAQNGITDEGQCGGNSWSFREGCASYVRENQSESEQDEY